MAPTDLLLIEAAGVLLAVAAAMDLMTRRIPNWLTLPAIIIGLAVLSIKCLHGYPVRTAALTSAVALAMPYGLWLAGAWGGGDAKACIGTFLIACPAFPALYFALSFSGCLALLLIARLLYSMLFSKRAGAEKTARRPLGPALLATYLLSTGACMAFFGGTS